jgi:hypothetical protein
MLQLVKATDSYRSQLFQWDVERQVLSIPHGKEIWYLQLEENGLFNVLESKPKPAADGKSRPHM